MRISARNQGFTLIELLIVVSLITILTGAMIPRFTGYLDTQNLRQAQEQVKSDLRSAVVRALSGVGAANPNLSHWGVIFTADGSDNFTYLTVACSDNACVNRLANLSQTSEKLPGDIEVKSNINVIFKVVNGDTVAGVDQIVSIGPVGAATGSNKCAQVIVNPAGMVKKGGVPIACP